MSDFMQIKDFKILRISKVFKLHLTINRYKMDLIDLFKIMYQNSESIKSGTGTVNRVGNSSTKSTTTSIGTTNKSGNGLSHQISHSSTSSGCSSASSSTSSSAAVRRSRRQDPKMLFIMQQQQQQQQSTQNHTQVDPQMLLSGSSANILANHRSPNILSSSSSNSILSSSKSKIDSSNNVQTSSFTPNNNVR